MRKFTGIMTIGVFVAVAALFAACGGGSSSSGTTTTEDGASVTSLSSLPNVDLSNYDYSSSASASVSTVKGMGDNVGAVGRSSRAGCEANAHKSHIIMESQMVQLDRCFPEAGEMAGAIEIPSDLYAYYRIVVPQEMAQTPPASVAKQDEPPEGGPRGGTMLMRLGRFNGGNELRVDMCNEADDGSVSRESESTYSVSGNQYIINAIRKGDFGGHTFQMAFDLVVDAASVNASTGIADLGTSGSIIADGRFIDSFGQGQIHFEALAASQSNLLYGSFAGEFVDEFLGGAQSFTDKMYTQFGGASGTGSGKWYFEGTFPAFPVSMMMPPDMPDAELADFLNFMSQELGVDVNENTYTEIYTCPNPNCLHPSDPDHDPENCKMMLAVADAEGNYVCEETGKTGVESFQISGSGSNLVFTIIADADSAFFDAVNAYNIAALDPVVPAIEYTRAWDCTPEGSWNGIDMEAMVTIPDQCQARCMADPLDCTACVDEYCAVITTADPICKWNQCIAIEQKAMAGGGMGEFRCHQEEMVDDISAEGESEGGGFDF